MIAIAGAIGQLIAALDFQPDIGERRDQASRRSKTNG